jgi:hypothetical protein
MQVKASLRRVEDKLCGLVARCAIWRGFMFGQLHAAGGNGAVVGYPLLIRRPAVVDTISLDVPCMYSPAGQ